MWLQIISLILVGILWGGTNPLIKKNSQDIVKVKADSKLIQFLLEFKFLATNFKYLIPMLLNQAGSVLFYLTLIKTDVTLAVPVANSLTFLFTAVAGWFIEHESPKRGTIIGAVMVIVGTTLCCFGKYEEPT